MSGRAHNKPRNIIRGARPSQWKGGKKMIKILKV